MARNLLKNPSGEDQLEFWELMENGGDHWQVEDLSGAAGHKFGSEGVAKYFATSFQLCLKRQVIDLLEEGYTPDQLDDQPKITVKDWYSGRTDRGCTYQITVRLLDENKEVMQEFKPDLVTLDPVRDDVSWKQVSHTFSQYGPRLRFISFEHGGQDTKVWAGWYGVRVTGSSITLARPVSARNLLQNPSGEDQLGFWELTENGGDHWQVEDLSGAAGHKFGSEGVAKYFATSFQLCLKRQVIDLLEEGYTPDQLDDQPTITVKDWYSGRTDCGCTYQITVRLLDENKEVMQEFKPDLVTLDPVCNDVSWKQVSHTFSQYGPGLRFISFEHGGQDTKVWAGWYGVRVTGSSITLACPVSARNLLQNPSGEDQLGFWELTENGGDHWQVEDLSGATGNKFGSEGVTKYFATSFQLCLKRQVIDLLEEGYTPDQLDDQPKITVKDWYSGRTDCGCTYQITVRLLDENKEVMQEFKPDLVTLDPVRDDVSWKQVSHTFSQYGPRLRFISFEHGGQDTKVWAGWYGVRVTGSSITLDQLGFWELTENGGDHWQVEDLSGAAGHKFGSEGVAKYFATSFQLCLKRQVIDLLEEGYTPDQLDDQPKITVKDWYSGRTDRGCTYQITVRLLDENKEVMQEFKPDLVTLDPVRDDVSWKQVSHTFSQYGPRLRFISFEHGGQDTKVWAGWYGVRVTGSSITLALPVSARNLLQNPSGEDQLGFWELTENGGDHWQVEDLSGAAGHKFGSEGVAKYFATSFQLCLKRQVIDLLEEGYTPDQLDDQPTITVKDWYSGRTDCGCTYQITVRLLDENKEVMQEFKPDLVTLDPVRDDVSWKQVSHTFSQYGPRLRFISFEHGGQDTKVWAGWYGVRVTGSSITLARPVSARNLLQNPSGEDQLGFWELTENGGDHWQVEDLSGAAGHKFGSEGVTKYFATSFQLCLKRQVIDLLEEGYTPDQLDDQPKITVKDWYSGRTDCGCTYQITVRLLDENKEVMQEFKPDLVTLDPVRDDVSWKQVSHTFSQYGPGLRFISFEHGGQDTKVWAGWYGVRVTGSSITLARPVSARNLLQNPSGEDQLGFWELTENGGDHWQVEDLSGAAGHKFGSEGVAKYFATSFQYSGRTDCGCTYQITVRLLDENKEVMQEFKPDLVTLDPVRDDVSWKQVSHTFSQYGPGLRFISFEHGGQDTKVWAGWYGVRVTGSSITLARPVSARNLLQNPSGEDQLGFWELTENGGDHWKVEDLSGAAGDKFGSEGVAKYFATSFQLCLKRQVIDLLEEGYTPGQLDNMGLLPTVTVKDWYSGRTDCGCTYQITVRLLDENKEVMQEFKPDLVTLAPPCDDVSWKQVSHTFSEYGPGLRFISFEHGGQDTKFWKGWYGVRVTDSSVTVKVV